MRTPGITATRVDLVSRVRQLVAARLQKLISSYRKEVDIAQLMPGKMLRTRLAARLAECDPRPADLLTLEHTCAATEIVHTASLCHDDVVDNGLVRRARPALWRATGPSGAVLIGDLLLCEALDLALGIGAGLYAELIVSKIKEMSATEVEQELKLRGKRLDEETCLRLARSKTGPLFAFVAYVCGGQDKSLCSALEEAGYHVGTAYQLADDLLDLLGKEDAAGKTLRTDAGRGKFTLANGWKEGECIVRERASELCKSALDCVEPWPWARRGLASFFACDLQPVFRRCGRALDGCLDPAV